MAVVVLQCHAAARLRNTMLGHWAIGLLNWAVHSCTGCSFLSEGFVLKPQTDLHKSHTEMNL